jgi:hypothetical protein
VLAAVGVGVIVAAIVLAGADESPTLAPAVRPVEHAEESSPAVPAPPPSRAHQPTVPPASLRPAPERGGDEPGSVAPPEPPAASEPKASKRGADPDEGSNLEEELRLLRAATGALAEGAPDRGLAALREHRRRFPRGALAGERELTRAKILCATGDAKQARRVARAYLDRHPSSHLAGRFREVCADAP